jgi:hypothetical protein
MDIIRIIISLQNLLSKGMESVLHENRSQKAKLFKTGTTKIESGRRGMRGKVNRADRLQFIFDIVSNRPINTSLEPKKSFIAGEGFDSVWGLPPALIRQSL